MKPISQITITLHQATPALIGSYKPEVIDRTNYIRPTSIKGLWRWCSRAIIAGALYDLGYEVSSKSISYIVGKVMGLGYVDPRGYENASSRFIIRIFIDNNPRIGNIRRASSSIMFRGRFISLQRIRLLAMNRSLEYFYDGIYTLKLFKTRSYDRDGEELALRSLILTFTLLGIGKGSRRGLGSLDVTNVAGFRLEKTLSQFLNKTYDLAVNIVKRYRNKLNLKIINADKLPSIPSFSKKKVNNIFLTQIYKLDNVNWIKIHNFFLRGNRCKVLHKDYAVSDILRKRLEAWILGLPRSQREKGYILDEVERRASPIIFTYHKQHIFGEGVYLTVLISKDWPENIRWIGDSYPYNKKINVTPNAIVSAIQNALDEIWQYSGVVRPLPVWPR